MSDNIQWTPESLVTDMNYFVSKLSILMGNKSLKEMSENKTITGIKEAFGQLINDYLIDKKSAQHFDLLLREYLIIKKAFSHLLDKKALDTISGMHISITTGEVLSIKKMILSIPETIELSLQYHEKFFQGFVEKIKLEKSLESSDFKKSGAPKL